MSAPPSTLPALDVERRLLAGEQVDETELYHRTAFVARTAARFVGYARPAPGAVVIRVFRLA